MKYLLLFLVNHTADELNLVKYYFHRHPNALQEKYKTPELTAVNMNNQFHCVNALLHPPQSASK